MVVAFSVRLDASDIIKERGHLWLHGQRHVVAREIELHGGDVMGRHVECILQVVDGGLVTYVRLERTAATFDIMLLAFPVEAEARALAGCVG